MFWNMFVYKETHKSIGYDYFLGSMQLRVACRFIVEWVNRSNKCTTSQIRDHEKINSKESRSKLVTWVEIFHEIELKSEILHFLLWLFHEINQTTPKSNLKTWFAVDNPIPTVVIFGCYSKKITHLALKHTWCDAVIENRDKNSSAYPIITTG